MKIELNNLATDWAQKANDTFTLATGAEHCCILEYNTVLIAEVTECGVKQGDVLSRARL